MSEGTKQIRRIALGTVQFGQPYGIANSSGTVALDEMASILAHAELEGMDTLDTAADYGESERRLGELGTANWRVVSKLPEVQGHGRAAREAVRRLALESLDRLHCSRLHGLLLHRPEQLLGDSGSWIYEGLVELKETGVTSMIGVSVYDPEEVAELCGRFRFDVVQAPLSVLDRRLIDSGCLGDLREAGTAVHVRSIFLQGLLLMPPYARPEWTARWRPCFKRFDDALTRTGLTAIEACLGYVLTVTDVERLVIGVQSHAQLIEIVEAARRVSAASAIDVACHDPELIDPRLWPRSGRRH